MPKFMLTGMTFAGGLELCEGLLSMGRNPTNDYRVSDPTVSSFHCELEITPAGVIVRDLGSTNGTFVDNIPVQESVVRPGQTLRLGQAEMRLEVAPAADTSVEVRIPKIERPAPATHLLDGRLACRNHPGNAAAFRCTACNNVYCPECVKPLGLAGGQQRLFCPACSRPCVPLFPETPEKKPTFLGRLTQTIRIRRGNR